MLQRKKQPMPGFVLSALQENNVLRDYQSRPDYQKNDYLMWINNAKQESTKQKRLNQMVDELKSGGIYMNMEHPASRKK